MTSYVNTLHFAPQRTSPERESRIVWYAPVGDDGKNSPLSNPLEGQFLLPRRIAGKGKEGPSPLEQIIGDNRRHILDEEGFLTLLKNASGDRNAEELRTFLLDEENQRKILDNLAREKRRMATAYKVKGLLTDLASDENANIKLLTGELKRVFVEEQIQTVLRAKKEEVEMVTKEDTQAAVIRGKAKKGSREKDPASVRAVLLRYGEVLPLFASLDRALVLPGMPTFDHAITALCDPLKRTDLVLSFAGSDTRQHALEGLQPENAEARADAVDGLCAFLAEAQYLLPQELRAQFLDGYSRTRGLGTFLREYTSETGRKDDERPDEAETFMKEGYRKKAESVSAFLKMDREVRTGKGALWTVGASSTNAKSDFGKRLAEYGEKNREAWGGGPTVFGELGEALQGGWADELPIADGEKYHCAVIALEEIGLLLLQAAAGFTRIEGVSDMRDRLKMSFLTAARRRMNTHEEKQQDPAVRMTDTGHLLKEAEDLRGEIDAVFARGEQPSSPLVNEFLLLVAWLRNHGVELPQSEFADVTDRLAQYGTHPAKAPEELDRLAKADLSSIAALEPVQWELLGTDYDYLNPRERQEKALLILHRRNPRTLTLALAAVEEERQIRTPEKSDDPAAAVLREYTWEEGDAIAESDEGGKRTTLGLWLRRFRKKAGNDEVFTEKLQSKLLKHRRLNGPPSPEQRKRKQAYLADEEERREGRSKRDARSLHAPADAAYLRHRNDTLYDAENHARQQVDTLTLDEARATLVRTLEAQIARVAKAIGGELTQRFYHPSERGETGIMELDSTAVFGAYARARDACEAMERCSITDASDAVAAAQNACDQLDHLADTARDPFAEARELTLTMQEGQKSAASLLSAVGDRMTDADREGLEEYAVHKSPVGASAGTGLAFFEENPEALLIAERESAAIGKKQEDIAQQTEASPDAFEGLCDTWERRAQATIDDLPIALGRYDVPEEYGFNESLTADGKEALRRIGEARKFRGKRTAYAEQLLAEAMRGIERIEECIATLDQALEGVTEGRRDVDVQTFMERTDLPGSAWGVFNPKHGILLNATNLASKDPHAREATLREEKMHALHYALRQYGYPLNISSAYTRLTKDSRVPQDLLERCAKRWIPRGTEMSKQQREQAIGDELLAKWDVYRWTNQKVLDDDHLRRRTVPLTRDDVTLFRKLKELDLTVIPPRVAQMRTSTAEDEYLTRAAQGDDEEESTDKVKPEAPQEGKTSLPIGEDLRDAKRFLFRVEGFLETHPAARTNGIQESFTFCEEKYKQLLDQFIKHPHPEEDPLLCKQITVLKRISSKMAEDVRQYDYDETDVRGEPQSSRGLIKGLFEGVSMVCIWDVIQIYKDICEDIKRQHTRHQQNTIGIVGHSLTSWIPKNVIYAGKLQDEFIRRMKHAEHEEVEQWKKSLEELDSYELQEMLAKPANADHAKAILFILSERGRVDWNDEHLWRSLSKLSHFKMPIEKCKRNDNMREMWLRKLCTDIWEDKDIYNKWKTTNAGKIKSEKGSFTEEADRLSNIGDMANELAKQLRIFRACKKEGQLIDDAVNPHLYEELIHYAIRNGKMSMEDKFFYLVQGIDYGILSIDRLRSLAGEEGGCLQTFPFIDYFYGRNNSLAEVHALATRLRECDDDGDPAFYKPGLKTTLWLELEVAREEKVQERLLKGSNKRAADMDHDDMHFFVPRLDLKTIDGMATPQGGGRPQVSNAGWRNAYTGYNSFFKSLGMLVRLEEDGQFAKFTELDAKAMVKALAGFVRMDGIMTKRSSYGDTEGRRNSISWSELRNAYSVVANGEETVYQERKHVNDFVREILDAYVGEDADLTPEFIEDLLFDTERKAPTDAQKKSSFEKSDRCDTVLQRAIDKRGLGPLKSILAKYSDIFNSHLQKKDYTFEKVKQAWQTKRQFEQSISPPKSHAIGGHHHH